MKNGPLDMNMGGSKIHAYEVVNDFSERKLANILFELGEEKFAKRIARNIVKYRKIKFINSTKELSDLINNSVFLLVQKNIKSILQPKHFKL